jgi:hypothetical protein
MNSKTAPEMLDTAFLRLRGIVGGIIFIDGVKGANMTKKTAISLSLLLLAGTLMMLVPSEILAQGPFSPRPYAFAWDWGVAPFDSPYGYLNGPVDPFSAEWAPWDVSYTDWASTAWALGYNGWDQDAWWCNFLRLQNHRQPGSGSTGVHLLAVDSWKLNVALMRPMPDVRHRDDLALVRSLDETDRPARTLRGVPHPRPASAQNPSLVRSAGTPSYGRGNDSGRSYGSGGYSGQNSSSIHSTGTTSYSGSSYSTVKSR